jgi:predicted  nucleic acid-binding Zn-ribbon protein
LSSLREKLKALEELQKVDLEINSLQADLDRLPARKVQLEAAVVESRKAYDSERDRLAANEKERRQLESLLAMERDKVKKWEGRLGEIKTPREYAALSREIDIAKKANETQTELIKNLSSAAAEIQKRLDDLEETLATREQDAKGGLDAFAKQQTELEERRAALGARRSEEAKKVDPTLLGKYENIKRKRAGIAVVPVVSGTCKGCNMNIPPQLANVLRRADSVELCPSCNRIIYSQEAVNPPAPA